MTQMNTDNAASLTNEEVDNRDFMFEVDEVFHITTHHSVVCGRLISGTLRLYDKTLVKLEDGTSKQAGMTWFNIIVPGKTGGIYTGDDVHAPCTVCIQVFGVQNRPVKVPQTLRIHPCPSVPSVVGF